MATSTAVREIRRVKSRQGSAIPGPVSVLICSALAFVLLGYHPAAEDGGIYAAALTARLQPNLFSAEHGFAVAHTGHSLFIPLLALFIRLSSLPPASALLLTYAAALLATVAAAWALLCEFTRDTASRHAALLLFAVSLGLPIAGTSLYLVDPYVTARSITTPLLLLALYCLLKQRVPACGACLLIAFALHPMMAAWGLLPLVLLLALRSGKRRFYISLVVTAFLLTMAATQQFGAADSVPLRTASLTRDYWFPWQWAPYELVGLVAPPVLLGVLALSRRWSMQTGTGRSVAGAAALSAAAVATGALCLLHVSNQSLLLARMQPLRSLHFVYCVFLLLLGVWCGEGRSTVRKAARWTAILAAAAGLLFMQRQLYAHTDHVEWPGRPPSNGYGQAFLWAREHTPTDALFALDANYTRAAGEDAVLFRAVAQRSSLPDAAKDGGIASVTPALAPEWLRAAEAQRGLALLSDAERVARVRPLGATWIVLPAGVATGFACPFRNRAAQVCRLP